MSHNTPSSSNSKGKQSATPIPTQSAADIDIRTFPGPTRQALSTRPLIQIFTGPTYITDIPLALFTSTSTKPELYNGERITLAPGLDTYGIVQLITYIKRLPFWTNTNLLMPCPTNMPAILSVTAAAIDLGMDKYVAHIYRKCEAVLRNHFPSYATLDALACFATQHARLLYIVASQNLAVRMRADGIPDREGFEGYLRTRNGVLGERIRVAMGRFEGYVRVNKRRGEELVERVERARKNQVVARIADGGEWEGEKRKREEEKEFADRVYWEFKKAEEEYDEKSVQEKLQLEEGDAGRKFTARDCAHWRKTRGTRLPAWAKQAGFWEASGELVCGRYAQRVCVSERQ